MNKLSLFFRSLSVSLVIMFFTNSIGYAKEPSIPNASPNCGEWKIESGNWSNDQRIGVTLLQQATGNDCSRMFTLENRTGTLLGGGYSLALTTSSSNADVQFLPYDDPLLVPGLNIEIRTTPIDINKQARTILQGEVTLGSLLAVDLSFFVMKTIIDLIPLPTGCLISYDQLFLISLRTAPILENTARLASKGDLIGSKDEFSRVITVFHEKAADAARDIGIGCFADLLKSIVGKPIVVAKIILSYITWVPVVIFDYFRYGGQSADVLLVYSPQPAIELVGRVDGLASDVAVQGNYAYVARGCSYTETSIIPGGLHIFDVSNPSAPIEIAVYLPQDRNGISYGACVEKVVISGSYAYITANGGRWSIL